MAGAYVAAPARRHGRARRREAQVSQARAGSRTHDRRRCVQRVGLGSHAHRALVALGFDASESSHRFVIEWNPSEIRWLVDEQLVHERVNWDPTPIPQLPMTLHVNTWLSRSRELAGRLASRRLPANAVVKSIAIEATLEAMV